jgi:hypothetical protein
MQQKKKQNTSSCNLRETAYQSSGCDPSRANGVLGSRSCVLNKMCFVRRFLPPFPPPKFAVEVRSPASSQSTFCANRVSPVVKFVGYVRPMSSCQIRSLYKTYGPGQRFFGVYFFIFYFLFFPLP